MNTCNEIYMYSQNRVQSRLGNKHISGIFNVIHPDLMVTVGVLSKTLSI